MEPTFKFSAARVLERKPGYDELGRVDLDAMAELDLERRSKGQSLLPSFGRSIERGFYGLSAGAIDAIGTVADAPWLADPMSRTLGLGEATNLEDLAEKMRETVRLGLPVDSDRPISNFIGESLGSVVPAVPAVAASALGAAPLTVTGLAVGGFGLSTLGAAGEGKENIREYEKRTGVDVDPQTEKLVQLGYGLTALATEYFKITPLLKKLGAMPLSYKTALGKAIATDDRGAVYKFLGQLVRSEANRQGKQEVYEGGIDKIFDQMYDKESGLIEKMKEYFLGGEAVLNYAGGAIGGVALSSGGGAIRSARDYVDGKVLTNKALDSVDRGLKFAEDKKFADEMKQVDVYDQNRRLQEEFLKIPNLLRKSIAALNRATPGVTFGQILKEQQKEIAPDTAEALFTRELINQYEQQAGSETERINKAFSTLRTWISEKVPVEKADAVGTMKLLVAERALVEIEEANAQPAEEMLRELPPESPQAVALEQPAKAESDQAEILEAQDLAEDREVYNNVVEGLFDEEDVDAEMIELMDLAEEREVPEETIDRLSALPNGKELLRAVVEGTETIEAVEKIYQESDVKRVVPPIQMEPKVVRTEKGTVVERPAAYPTDAELQALAQEVAAEERKLQAQADLKEQQKVAPKVRRIDSYRERDKLAAKVKELLDLPAEDSLFDHVDKQDYLRLKKQGLTAEQIADEIDYSLRTAFPKDENHPITAQRAAKDLIKSGLVDSIQLDTAQMPVVAYMVDQDGNAWTEATDPVPVGDQAAIERAQAQLVQALAQKGMMPYVKNIRQASAFAMKDGDGRIHLAISASNNGNVALVGHEAFHALTYRLGFNDPIVQQGMKITYGDVERLADLVGDYYAQRYMPKTVWQRVRNFLRALVARAKQVLGIQMTENELAQVLAGKIVRFDGRGVNPHLQGVWKDFSLNPNDPVSPELANKDVQTMPRYKEVLAQLEQKIQSTDGRLELKTLLTGRIDETTVSLEDTLERSRALIQRQGKVGEIFDKIDRGDGINDAEVGVLALFLATLDQRAGQVQDLPQSNERQEIINEYLALRDRIYRAGPIVGRATNAFKAIGRVSTEGLRKVAEIDTLKHTHRRLGKNKPPLSRWIRDVYISGLLWNPATWQLNFGTTLLNAAARVPNAEMRAVMDAILNRGTAGLVPRTRAVGESYALLFGLNKGKYRGVAEAKKALLEGVNIGTTKVSQDMQQETVGAFVTAAKQIDTKWGNAFDATVNLSGRIMSATDLLIKMAYLDMAISQFAWRKAALEDGLSGEAHRRKWQEYIEKLPADVEKAAIREAAKATFTSKPGYLTNPLLHLREQVPLGLGWLAVPFVTTLVNIAKVGIKLTPGANIIYNAPGVSRYVKGLKKNVLVTDANGALHTLTDSTIQQAREQFPDALNIKEVSQNQKDIDKKGVVTPTDMIADLVTSAVLAYMFSAMFGGADDDGEPFMTGAVPRDPGKRQLFYAKGMKPWSVDVGRLYQGIVGKKPDRKLWMFYGNIEPIGLPLKVLATWRDRMINGKVEENEDSYAMFMRDLIYVFKGVGFMDTIYGIGNDTDMQQDLERLVSNLNPVTMPFSSLNKAIARTADNTLRERNMDRTTQAFFDNIVTQMGQSYPFRWFVDRNPPQVDAFGEIIDLSKNNASWAHWTPLRWNMEDADAAELAMTRLGIAPRLPNRSMQISGKLYHIPDDLYWQYSVAYGKATKEEALKVANRAYFSNIRSKDRQKKLLEKAIGRGRDRARVHLRRTMMSLWRKGQLEENI